MRDEYDFRGGVRGKYAGRFTAYCRPGSMLCLPTWYGSGQSEHLRSGSLKHRDDIC
jgi:hypothetical protein